MFVHSVGERLDARDRLSENKGVDILGAQPLNSHRAFKLLRLEPLTYVPSYVLTTCRFATCRPTWYLDGNHTHECENYQKPLGRNTDSSEHALPPRMSRTRLACSSAFPQLLRLTRLIISGATLPSSFSRPT